MSREFSVYTDLDPQALTEVAAETYRLWLEFALGREAIGGHTLMHPSGRYAASMSWKRIGEAQIAIIADENIAPEAKWIEEGTSGADMKDHMLAGGKTAKDGHRYRVIPMRRDATAPGFDLSEIVTSSAGERLPTRTARMWARPRWRNNPSRFRTMTDRPGSAPWVIPAMPAFSPAAILADMLRQDYGTAGR